LTPDPTATPRWGTPVLPLDQASSLLQFFSQRFNVVTGLLYRLLLWPRPTSRSL